MTISHPAQDDGQRRNLGIVMDWTGSAAQRRPQQVFDTPDAVEALVQCLHCNHHETRYSGMGSFAYLECSKCKGRVEVLVIDGKPVRTWSVNMVCDWRYGHSITLSHMRVFTRPHMGRSRHMERSTAARYMSAVPRRMWTALTQASLCRPHI